MKAEEIINILERKLETLELDKKVAYATGNLDLIIKIEQEINDTKEVIQKLL